LLTNGSSNSSKKVVHVAKCWLCTFAHSRMAQQIAAFVFANAGSMDPAIIADQIKQEVRKKVFSSFPLLDIDVFAGHESVCTCLGTNAFH
jgi:hypothetical protein